MSQLLTVTAAAKRVKRSRRTIERWIAGDEDHKPMPVMWFSNVRYVRIDALLAEFRNRTLADPAKGRDLSAETRQSHRVQKNLERQYVKPVGPEPARQTREFRRPSINL